MGPFWADSPEHISRRESPFHAHPRSSSLSYIIHDADVPITSYRPRRAVIPCADRRNPLFMFEARPPEKTCLYMTKSAMTLVASFEHFYLHRPSLRHYAHTNEVFVRILLLLMSS